jgi:hypothetical protein
MGTMSHEPVTVGLWEVAFARSGDKGDVADLNLFAPDGEVYAVLADQVGPDRVATLLQGLVAGPVTRYALPNVWAVKFVCAGALDGGAAASPRADNLGKALAAALLRLTVELPAEAAERWRGHYTPPGDPYAGAEWVVR